MKIRLPGVCIVCRTPVVWTGKRWQTAPVGRGRGRPHDCPRCGARMPGATEPNARCHRPAGHEREHRSAYALANARLMRTGRAA